MKLRPAGLRRPVRERVQRGLHRAALMLAAASTVVLAPASVVRAQDDQKAPVTIRDTEIEEILHKECDPVFKAAGLDPKDTTILIVEHEMNAETLSGRVIAIGTDLIEKTDNPNQLIGVMAHETGHAAAGHPVRAGEMMRAGMAPLLLTLGLSVLAAAAGAPDAAAALAGSSGYFGTLNVLAYSREQESRADQAAITYLTAAHESAKGLVDFFDNFRYEEVFSEARRYAFFQTHPITADRIEAVRRRAQEQPYYDAKDPPDLVAEHAIMKAKLAAFLDPPQETFNTYKEDDKSFPARYARAIAYYRATDPDDAIKALEALIADYPKDPYLWELKGQVLFESGRAKEAEAAHRRSVELKPDAPLLQINLAQAILAQEDGKRADEAIPHLQKALALEKDNTFAWQLMAQAYDAKGDGGDARLASAEARFSVGDLTQARVFAMRALPMLKKNTPEWRRATDIVLVSKPSSNDLKMLAKEAERGG